jgi:hypothetical protein
VDAGRHARPEFKLVTGVSAGALTAPFAFLGSARDPQLTAVYTGIKSADVFESRWFTAAIWDDAMSDTAPLWRLISRFANQEMLDAIAREYANGRLLLIGTTHPDRLAGMGFLSGTAAAFALIAAAHGTLVAGQLANRIFYLGARLAESKFEIGGVVALLLCLVCGP